MLVTIAQCLLPSYWSKKKYNTKKFSLQTYKSKKTCFFRVLVHFSSCLAYFSSFLAYFSSLKALICYHSQVRVHVLHIGHKRSITLNNSVFQQIKCKKTSFFSGFWPILALFRLILAPLTHIGYHSSQVSVHFLHFDLKRSITLNILACQQIKWKKTCFFPDFGPL